MAKSPAIGTKFKGIAMSAALLTGLVGCANPDALVAGTSRDQVLARFGKPSADFKLPDGERLQYSRQPAGQQVYNVDLDAGGKVVAATQVLTEPQFARVKLDNWTALDLEREFGKPAQIDGVYSFKGVVWTYRYHYYGTDKQFHFFIDPAGTVRKAHATAEIKAATVRAGP
jgi:hypothetical protein